MPQKLTLLIPCKNEAGNIAACIASARAIADEVLVADSGSIDGTLEIVADLDCRVIEREYIHSGDFKNWAIPQASHEWVLLLDADERVTPELRDEIAALLAATEDNQLERDGYWIYRRNFFFGHEVRHCGWGNDRVLRLFRRDIGVYVGETDHAEIHLPEARCGVLSERMEHYSYWSYDDYFRKFLRYTRQKAELRFRAGKRTSLPVMLLTVPFRFFRDDVLRGGFLDGAIGLQVCMLSAMASFMKQAWLWQMRHGRQPQETAAQESVATTESVKSTSRAAA